PSRLKKAHLLGALLAGLRRDPEFSEPDFACAIDFGRARGPGCLLGKLLIEALRAQLVRDARRSILARKSVGARFRVALVGQEPALRQVFEQGFEVLLRTRVRPELPRQLGSAVLAPREKPQGPLAQRRPLFFHTSAVTGANASGVLMPSFSRIFASISAASSGFSFRKSRALSLPWPMRSFLYWYQAPDLSTTPQLTPSSRISPSRDTPSPWRISNSASRNGGATLFFTTFTRVSEPITSSP